MLTHVQYKYSMYFVLCCADRPNAWVVHISVHDRVPMIFQYHANDENEACMNNCISTYIKLNVFHLISVIENVLVAMLLD